MMKSRNHGTFLLQLFGGLSQLRVTLATCRPELLFTQRETQETLFWQDSIFGDSALFT